MFLSDMNFLFLTLTTSLLNGGQLHRLMVEKHPYFISLDVICLSNVNQGIHQTHTKHCLYHGLKVAEHSLSAGKKSLNVLGYM